MCIKLQQEVLIYGSHETLCWNQGFLRCFGDPSRDLELKIGSLKSANIIIGSWNQKKSGS